MLVLRLLLLLQDMIQPSISVFVQPLDLAERSALLMNVCISYMCVFQLAILKCVGTHREMHSHQLRFPLLRATAKSSQAPCNYHQLNQTPPALKGGEGGEGGGIRGHSPCRAELRNGDRSALRLITPLGPTGVARTVICSTS